MENLFIGGLWVIQARHLFLLRTALGVVCFLDCCIKYQRVNVFYSSVRRSVNTAKRMKFFIKDFVSIFDQISRKVDIWSHLRKKTLNKKLSFLCSVSGTLFHLVALILSSKFSTLILKYLGSFFGIFRL